MALRLTWRQCVQCVVTKWCALLSSGGYIMLANSCYIDVLPQAFNIWLINSEHSFVWCWNWDTSESRSEVRGEGWKNPLPDRVRNEDLLHRVKEERNSLRTIYRRGHAMAQCLRHCATNWKVAGSIPDGVIGIFRWHSPSGHTMALGSTQPLTEMSNRNISWG
jgi:hypothetical protein